LAAGIAHDFNNLLTAIGGYSELLLEQLDADDRRHADAEAIRRATERANQLTRRLLAFSGRETVRPRVLDLNDVLAAVLETVKQLLGTGIELIVALEPGAGSVKLDPGQLEQVILNLVLNARDALAGTGRITISTAASELDPEGVQLIAAPAGRYACLSISDTGTGIDAATRAQLFEPFFTTKEGGKGTGLGLTTVYRIVAENGGTIALESNPSAGSTFHIYLPVVDGGESMEFAAAAAIEE